MKSLLFRIEGQRMDVRQSTIASDSINFIEGEATFTEEWTGLEKTFIFEKGEIKYPVILEDNKILKEHKLNLGAGVWKIVAFGNDVNGKTRITTIPVKIHVSESSLSDGLPEVPKSYAEQILEKASRAEQIAESVRNDADNNVFKGADGLTAYEVAVKNGFKGTEQEWLDSLAAGSDVDLTEYLKKVDVAEWAKQPQKPTYTATEVGALADSTKIPSKTSDLENDSGFLTQHQSLTDYAKKSDLIPKADKIYVDENFYSKPDIDVQLKNKTDRNYVDEQLATKQPKGDYLQQTDLQGGINSALEQAKATGLFDGKDGLKILSAKQGGIEQHAETEWDTFGRIGQQNQMDNVFNTNEFVVGDTIVIAGHTTDSNKNVMLIGKVLTITLPKTVKFQTVGYLKDGANGTNGKTPVKGTDYFTESDKTELVNDVLNALPKWNGGAF